MIDLHCHLLPGIDDGAQDASVSLAMARLAVADGIQTTCCTPHIYPGLYENTGPDIARRVAVLQEQLSNHGIDLKLAVGADAHLVPDFLTGLRSGRIPTIAGSRYLLLEPSHHVRPPRFVESVFELIGSGYTPILTHPERLTWVQNHLNEFLDLARSGAWIQVTGGALTGAFGDRVRRTSERMIGDGWVDVLASDGHTTGTRSPVLAKARARAAQLVGQEEADAMVLSRPSAVLANRPAHEVVRPPVHRGRNGAQTGTIRGLMQRIWPSTRRVQR